MPTTLGLTPQGAERVSLKEVNLVELAGERKPTELKVHTIARNGGRPVRIDHPPTPHPHGHEHADPRAALNTAEANGFTILGEPRRSMSNSTDG